VALPRTDILEEFIVSIIRMKRISVLGTTLAITIKLTMPRRNTILREFQLLVTANVVLNSPILVTLMMRRYVLPKRRFLQDLQRHIPEDGILHSHRLENLKSYIALTVWAL
jgi:hypothetical protein